MKREDRLVALRQILSLGLAPAAPPVEAMRPVVRSADQFLVGQPHGTRLTDLEKARVRKRLAPVGGGVTDDDGMQENEGATWESAGERPFIGNLLVEWGFDAADNAKFQYFLQYYEPYFPAVTPAGIRYRGTYAVASTTVRTAGAYRTLWVFHSRDKWIKVRDEIEEDALGPITLFGALLKRYFSYHDRRPTARRSAQVYQIAWGASVVP